MEGDFIIRDNKLGEFHTLEFNTELLISIFNNKAMVYKTFDIFNKELEKKDVVLIIAMVYESLVDIR